MRREIDGLPMLVMEYIEGLDLGEILRRSGPLRVPEACELARQTAVGLQYVHEHGLVHRDIKPSNVMLSPQGEVKILDLGLARFHFDQTPDAETIGGGPKAASEMTVTDQAMGTIDYMAPEQVANSRTVDIRADLYSLGCTLYKLFAGRAPLGDPQHHGLREKLECQASQPITPIRQLRPDVPEPLAAVLDRLLAHAPADRYATPAEAAAALAPWCGGADLSALLRRAEGGLAHDESAVARPVPTEDSVHKPRPLAGRSGGKRILAAAIGLSLFGGIGVALGIIIHLKKDNKTTTIEVPEGSTARFDARGAMTLELPSAPGRQWDSFLPNQARRHCHSGRVQRITGSRPLPRRRGLAAITPCSTRPRLVHLCLSRSTRCTTNGTWCGSKRGRTATRPGPRFAGGERAPLTTVYRLVFCDTDDEDHLLIPMSRPPLEPPPGKGLSAPLALRAVSDVLLCWRRNVHDSPKTMDFRTYRPALKNSVGNLTGLGIYQIDGDNLKICLRAVPSEHGNRPKSFQVQPESGDILFVLARHRPSEDERAFEQLDMWRILEHIRNGKPTPPDQIRFLRYDVDLDWISITRVPSSSPGAAPSSPAPTKVTTNPLALDFAEARIVLDETKRPKRLTLFPCLITYADDNENGQRFLRWAEPFYGIYQFEGGHLRIAYRKGRPPEKFASPPGSNVTLLVLQKTASPPPPPALPTTPYVSSPAGGYTMPVSPSIVGPSGPATACQHGQRGDASRRLLDHYGQRRARRVEHSRWANRRRSHCHRARWQDVPGVPGQAGRSEQNPVDTRQTREPRAGPIIIRSPSHSAPR